MARTSRLDTRPGLIEQVAEMAMMGLTNQEIADTVGENTHKDTIRAWKKDERVQAAMSTMRQESINRIDSKIVSRLQGIIDTPGELEKLDIDTLLKIRKELLPPAAQRVTVSRGVDEAAALTELYQLLNERPEVAAALGLGGPPPDEDHALPEATDTTGVEIPPAERAS